MMEALIFYHLPLFNFSHIERFRSPCFSTFMLCGVFMIMVWFYEIIKIIYGIIQYKTYDRYGWLNISISLFLVQLKNYVQTTLILKAFCPGFLSCFSIFTSMNRSVLSGASVSNIVVGVHLPGAPNYFSRVCTHFFYQKTVSKLG